MTLIDFFLEVVGNFLEFFVLLLQLVLQFFEILSILHFLELLNLVLEVFHLALKFLNLHFFTADVLLEIFVILAGQFEVFLQ